MRVHKFLQVSEYAQQGYNFTCCTDESYEWMVNSADYKFVETTEIDIDEHQEWLAEKGIEKAAEMEQESIVDLAKKQNAIADFKSKFLLIGSDS
jgi:hypothetical protein